MTKQQIAVPNVHNSQSNSDIQEGYVVGADIGGTNLRLALADHEGKVIARWSASTAGIRDANIVVNLIAQGIDHLLQQASIPRSALRAIGAGAPGVTDTDAGVVIATSYLLGWRNVPLRQLLETALGIPAAIDNDVNLAALGEHSAGAAAGTKDFVFIAIGTGVGAGIIINGQLVRGSIWCAGEIGYMLLPGIPDAPVERGQPGALEGVIGGEGIRTYWQAQWTEAITTLPKEATATQIFDHATEENSLAAQILDRAARTFAYAIYNTALMLNCPLFVLGGGVGMHPALIEATQKFLDQRNTRAKSRLAPSSLGADAQLIGAIHLALQTAAIA
jgi:glucokinase